MQSQGNTNAKGLTGREKTHNAFLDFNWQHALMVMALAILFYHFLTITQWDVWETDFCFPLSFNFIRIMRSHLSALRAGLHWSEKPTTPSESMQSLGGRSSGNKTHGGSKGESGFVMYSVYLYSPRSKIPTIGSSVVTQVTNRATSSFVHKNWTSLGQDLFFLNCFPSLKNVFCDHGGMSLYILFQPVALPVQNEKSANRDSRTGDLNW